MRDIEFHDDFTPVGGSEGFPAVTLSAGLTWLDVYAAASVDRNLVSECFVCDINSPICQSMIFLIEIFIYLYFF